MPWVTQLVNGELDLNPGSRAPESTAGQCLALFPETHVLRQVQHAVIQTAIRACLCENLRAVFLACWGSKGSLAF